MWLTMSLACLYCHRGYANFLRHLAVLGLSTADFYPKVFACVFLVICLQNSIQCA